MKNIIIAFILIFISAFFVGCAPILDTTYMGNSNYERLPPAKEKAFNDKLEQVALIIKKDSRYKKIDLNTKQEKVWFKKLSYRLWNKEITKAQFIDTGVTRYPSNRYEFELIAKWL